MFHTMCSVVQNLLYKICTALWNTCLSSKLMLYKITFSWFSIIETKFCLHFINACLPLVSFRKPHLFPNTQSWLPSNEPCSDHLFLKYTDLHSWFIPSQFPSCRHSFKVIKCMHFTNREYFPVSKVLLYLEITFAVINKIPSHSFGAYDWVSWIHISEFSFIPHFSADIVPHWTSHFIPAKYYILCIFNILK